MTTQIKGKTLYELYDEWLAKENANLSNDIAIQRQQGAMSFIDFVCAPDEEKDICPHCNVNEVDIDDFGLTTCNECFGKHPEWKKSLRQQEMQEAYDTGRPMSDND